MERQRATDEDAAHAVKAAHDGQAADVPRNDGDEHPGGDLHGDEDDKEGDDARLGHGKAAEHLPERAPHRGVEAKGEEEGAQEGGQREQLTHQPATKATVGAEGDKERNEKVEDGQAGDGKHEPQSSRSPDCGDALEDRDLLVFLGRTRGLNLAYPDGCFTWRGGPWSTCLLCRPGHASPETRIQAVRASSEKRRACGPASVA